MYGSSGKESLKRLRAAIRLSCLKRFCVRQSAPKELKPAGRWALGLSPLAKHGCDVRDLMRDQTHAKTAKCSARAHVVSAAS